MCVAVSQDTLIKLTGTSMVVSYSFVAVSALIARASGATNHGPYKMPWWPLVPILAILALVYVVTQQPWELLRITIIELGVGLSWWLLFVMPRRHEVWLLKQPALDSAESTTEASIAASAAPH
jgi:amino acid transporter